MNPFFNRPKRGKEAQQPAMTDRVYGSRRASLGSLLLASLLLTISTARAQTTAPFNSAGDIPITSAGYTASGIR